MTDEAHESVGAFSLMRQFCPGRMIFMKLWGSHSHNTALPESDRDYLGVYVSPTKDVLSMNPPPDTVDHKKPDFQCHEILKFCRLLIKGNPGVLETLFTERDATWTPEWEQLRMSRNEFLSIRCLKQYLGYIQGQRKKLETGGYLHTTGGTYNTKWAYHMIRLGFDAKRIRQGKPPIVWKESVSYEHKTLMQIRHGEWSKAQVINLSEQLEQDTAKIPPCPFPEEGNRGLLENWLINVRLSKEFEL